MYDRIFRQSWRGVKLHYKHLSIPGAHLSYKIAVITSYIYDNFPFIKNKQNAALAVESPKYIKPHVLAGYTGCQSYVCLLVDTDGMLLLDLNGVNDTYGNSVVLRDSSVDANLPFASCINRISTLTAGILKSFYVFIERQNTYPSLKRLQIWRRVSGSDYTLIWETLVNVTSAHTRALYKVWLRCMASIFYLYYGSTIEKLWKMCPSGVNVV